MEENENGNPEIDTQGPRGSKTNSPISEFFLFLFIFGWEGPFGIFLGIQQDNSLLIIAGIFLTLFFWWLLDGISRLKEFLVHLSAKEK